MFLEHNIYSGNKIVDERISRAIDNDHTAAMKAPNISKKHMKKKMNGGDPYNTDMITVCMLCKKAFKNHIFYRKHLRLHSEKTLVCSLCGKVFGKRHHLQGHMLTHSKHQYQCQICHKRFAQKSNFNQHLKFHASKKLYKCSICDKDFSQQEHLKAHLRHHNNERPFECDLCHKSFNIKSSLQRHMNCHTGEKPFICDICNRGYTRRSVLMLHIQQVHENKKPFQCDECQLCFSQKGNLQAHFRRKHLQPKSEGKRGKDKDGKSKRNLKRQHSRQRSNAVKNNTNKNFVSHLNSYSEDPSKKMIKARIDNTSLHSYASKVKAIVNRGAARVRESEDQKYVNKSKSMLYENGNHKVQSKGQSLSYNTKKLDMSPFDSNSSCSLSDEAVEAGCSSSGSDDIPEINFPSSILDPHSEEHYGMKGLTDFDTLFESNKGWEEFLISDTENMLSSSLNSEMDVFTSPSKVSNSLTKIDSDDLFSNLPWNNDEPLFTAEDLNEIKDISSICGVNSLIQGSLESIKFEATEQDKRANCNQNFRIGNTLLSNLHKTNFTESPSIA